MKSNADIASTVAASSPSSDEVVKALELDVVLGRLRPRERLIEDELIAQFNAKRHVIRTALTEMERLGLVDRRPNRGAVIREYTTEEVHELYQFRALLHAMAVDRMELPLSSTVIAELRDVHEAHRQAIANSDLAEVINQNNAFHDILFDQCHNRYLAEAIRHHAWMTHAIRSYRIGDPSLLKQAEREHLAIIEAAQAGDRPALQKLCVEHIEPSRDKYLNEQGQHLRSV